MLINNSISNDVSRNNNDDGVDGLGDIEDEDADCKNDIDVDDYDNYKCCHVGCGKVYQDGNDDSYQVNVCIYIIVYAVDDILDGS